jgi:hypothetical protein
MTQRVQPTSTFYIDSQPVDISTLAASSQSAKEQMDAFEQDFLSRADHLPLHKQGSYKNQVRAFVNDLRAQHERMKALNFDMLQICSEMRNHIEKYTLALNTLHAHNGEYERDKEGALAHNAALERQIRGTSLQFTSFTPKKGQGPTVKEVLDRSSDESSKSTSFSRQAVTKALSDMDMQDHLPPFELCDYRNEELMSELQKYIDKHYDPNKEDAIRDTMIRTSIKVGMHCVLGQHPITAIADAAANAVDTAAEDLKPRVELLKCPKLEDERIHAMYMVPTCQEAKDALLMGLELAKYPKKLLHDAEEFIGEFTMGTADRLGITEKNIRQIAHVAHQLITQKAPQTLKKAYEDWIESSISTAQNSNLTAKLSPEDPQTIWP